METYMLVNNFLMERNEQLVCQLGWPWIIQHRIAYATLFVSATLLIGWNAYRSLRGMEHVSLSVSQAIIWQFVVVSLAFGVFVAMGDLARGNGVYSFIVQVVSIVCVFAIRPIVLIPAIAATFGLVIWRSARLSAMSHGTLTNFISLGLVLIVACCVRYHTRMCDIRSQERLERYSFQDALTGLGNVRALYVDVQRSIGKRVNIAALDIDNFKTYNDRFGHETGDRILSLFATIISRELGGSIQLYRLGGDEYLAMSTSVPSDEFAARVAKSRKVFESRMADNHIRIGKATISFSIGYASGRINETDDIKPLLNKADVEMYQEKHSHHCAS